MKRTVAIALLLSLNACHKQPTVGIPTVPRTDLQKISDGLRGASFALNETALVVQDMVAQQMLTKAQAVVIVDVVERLTKGRIEAGGAVRKIETVTPEDKQRIFAIINPILQAASSAVNQNLAGLPPGAQMATRQILLLVQTSFAAVQLILASASRELSKPVSVETISGSRTIDTLEVVSAINLLTPHLAHLILSVKSPAPLTVALDLDAQDALDAQTLEVCGRIRSSN